MFWTKLNAIYQILEYNFNINFFREKDLKNYTIMHEIERIWLYLLKINGYYKSMENYINKRKYIYF